MTVWTNRMLLGFEKPHHMPVGEETGYLAFCEAFAED
jgi:hypothetical protein